MCFVADAASLLVLGARSKRIRSTSPTFSIVVFFDETPNLDFFEALLCGRELRQRDEVLYGSPEPIGVGDGAANVGGGACASEPETSGYPVAATLGETRDRGADRLTIRSAYVFAEGLGKHVRSIRHARGARRGRLAERERNERTGRKIQNCFQIAGCKIGDGLACCALPRASRPSRAARAPCLARDSP